MNGSVAAKSIVHLCQTMSKLRDADKMEREHQPTLPKHPSGFISTSQNILQFVAAPRTLTKSSPPVRCTAARAQFWAGIQTDAHDAALARDME